MTIRILLSAAVLLAGCSNEGPITRSIESITTDAAAVQAAAPVFAPELAAFIEEEAGGPLPAVPDEYVRRSPVLRDPNNMIRLSGHGSEADYAHPVSAPASNSCG
ncbi:MAG: hypothetical protein AB1651_15345 [Pseudomonadota bacterium]